MSGCKEKYLFAIAVLFCGYPQCFSIFEEDYCWRDYDGIIPHDAFKSGTDSHQRPTYLGQVLYENKLIPGNIYENKNEIHFEFGKGRTETKNVKILCTQYPEKFQWIPTRHTKVISMTHKHIFVAGYEKDHITYVGRAETYGEITVGKVVCHSSGCYELTTVHDGQWYPHYEFEILTYNSDSETTQSSSSSTSDIFATPYYNFNTTPFANSTSTGIMNESLARTSYPDITIKRLNSCMTIIVSGKMLLLLLCIVILI